MSLWERRLCTAIGWCAQCSILVGLFWKYFDVGQNVLFCGGNWAIFQGCVIFAFSLLVTRLLAANRSQFKRCLLVGPSTVMAAFLVWMLTQYPIVTKSGPIVTKEITGAMVAEQVPETFRDQWLRDHFERVKSERLTCCLITLCTGVIWVSQAVSGKEKASGTNGT
jgi:hypothetical protein